jgi:hypothetical protein
MISKSNYSTEFFPHNMEAKLVSLGHNFSNFVTCELYFLPTHSEEQKDVMTWRVLSYGISYRVVHQKSTDDSEEHVAFIFWVKQ